MGTRLPVIIRRLWYQKQKYRTGMSNYIPQLTVGYKYSCMPHTLSLVTQVLTWYTHSFSYALFYCGYLMSFKSINVICLPISVRVASLAVGQLYDCSRASEVALRDMGKRQQLLNTTVFLEHTIHKHTICKDWASIFPLDSHVTTVWSDLIGSHDIHHWTKAVFCCHDSLKSSIKCANLNKQVI